MMPEMPARGERYRASCMEGMSGRDRILCRLCLSPLPRSCFRFLAFFLFWRVPEDSFKRAAQKSAFQKRIRVGICPIEDSLSKNHLLSHPHWDAFLMPCSQGYSTTLMFSPQSSTIFLYQNSG